MKCARDSSAKASKSSPSRRQRATGSPRSPKGAAQVAPLASRQTMFCFSISNSRRCWAGIPILQAITMLRRRATSARLRSVLAEIEEAIRGGSALSQAFAAQGATFPRIYTASILAGERSGALDEVLSRYVNYMRRSVGLRRKIRGALAYPAFLLVACLGMVIFLTTYVVPRMSDLFSTFGNNLPTVTVIVLAISGWFTRNALWLVP